FEGILPYLGIEPVYTEAEAQALAKTVPSYVGLPVENAKAYAESRGISVEIVGDGAYVSKQSPSEGAYSGTLNKMIFYTEESVSWTYTVPNVVGKTPTEANKLLVDAGFNVKWEGASNGADVTVAMQYPSAGTVAERGSIVRVELWYMKETE
ncbi:MAG: PASTA domain-containing protein, partial [Clostridia bacterium]|nr:PASTA domain-containing protein [Clostridia bacterium]